MALAVPRASQQGALGIGVPSIAPYYSLTFNGATTYIDCGSNSSLDDLHAASFTFDGWVRCHTAAISHWIACKNGEVEGWEFWLDPGVSPALKCQLYFDTSVALSVEGAPLGITLNTWAHVCATYDATGDRKVYLAVDGIWRTGYTFQVAGEGPVISDASDNLLIGVFSDMGGGLDGDMGWFRISNNLRWTPGVNFTPPSRTIPPPLDANTVELWALDEGAGAVAAASVNAANNGAITDGVWAVAT